jgi:translation elongation factor EF-1beta
MPVSSRDVRNVKHEIYRYKKKAEIMSVVSQHHAMYYKKINNFFTALLIVMAAFVSILNSVQESAKINEQYMKFIMISMSAIITVLISFQRVFKWESKMNEYSKSAVSFNKLGHSINQKVISQDFDMNYLDSLIIVYDNSVEQISDGLKEHIIQKLKEQYKNISPQYLPLCFGVLDIRNPSMSDTEGGSSPTGDRRMGPLVQNNSFRNDMGSPS